MVKKYTCKNGLRIVLEEIPTVRSVSIGVWVLAGSRNETNKNNGISHFIEHMMFKGTENRSAREIAESFDAIGGQVNAFTSKEYTCYYAKVLDTHASYALEILGDMFFNSTFQTDEMEREKKVVYEEIKMYEDTPDDIVHDLLSRASFGKHPLGYPILGTEETLHSFTPEDLRDYMDHNYGPDNVVISVAGNVDESFFKEVEKLFGSYETNKESHRYNEPTFITEHINRKKETEQAHLCLGYSGLPLGAEDIYSLVVVNNVLGGSMSSRLFQEVRESKGLAYSVFSYHSSFLDNGLLTIYGGTGSDQLEVLKETIDDTVDELAKDGLTDKELKNSKEQLKGNLMLGLESTNSRMSRNGKNELLLKRHRTLDEVVEQIDAVHHDSVQNIIQKVFQKPYSSALIAPK
ncbi:M16 family metallopeptidase [Salinibacillus xinjiangensis]|uniref:Insulinase family protein n=1 Tax=Salinibacillus xinjiangensis TaxID=1229268 RepID=A0A6G1X355_9BACI|nr:pitrilysin family protein [Salinibacillus xinjiangensis]MRG85349.1 insulinase family protein [Salinibacillus xinjiangensis]